MRVEATDVPISVEASAPPPSLAPPASPSVVFDPFQQLAEGFRRMSAAIMKTEDVPLNSHPEEVPVAALVEAPAAAPSKAPLPAPVAAPAADAVNAEASAALPKQSVSVRQSGSVLQSPLLRKAPFLASREGNSTLSAASERSASAPTRDAFMMRHARAMKQQRQVGKLNAQLSATGV